MAMGRILVSVGKYGISALIWIRRNRGLLIWNCLLHSYTRGWRVVQTWIPVPILPLTSCMTYSKFLITLTLDFLICPLEMVMLHQLLDYLRRGLYNLNDLLNVKSNKSSYLKMDFHCRKPICFFKGLLCGGRWAHCPVWEEGKCLPVR